MNRLKSLRKSRGLVQKDVAEIANVAVSTYSYWESGKYDIDNASLTLLADFYGVTTDYILGRETPLSVPAEYANIPVAFFDGIKDLSQEDINDVIKFIDYLKSKKN